MDDMDTEFQQTLRTIQKTNFNNLIKLQAETTRIIDETISANRWSRRWEPVIMIASCLAVGLAITSAGAVIGKLFLQ
ncbi:hypothetical protein [Robbsia sp. KACC 23696]|uniref:hypothetical protein n=1 Tax=Robbsia sp. KACC 23696 TaxID=3149231 RepID=UPI00325C05B2